MPYSHNLLALQGETSAVLRYLIVITVIWGIMLVLAIVLASVCHQLLREDILREELDVTKPIQQLAQPSASPLPRGWTP